MIDPEKPKESLRTAMQFAQATIDALRSHVCVLDPAGTIVAVNRAWLAFAEDNLPLPANAAEGTNYLAVCDAATGPDSREAAAFAAGIRDVISGASDEFALEYPCHSPDAQRWFLGRVTPFPGAVPRRVVVVHEDITDRRQAEDSLRESQHLLEWIFKATPVMLYVFDLVEHRHVYSNQSAMDLLGYTPEQIAHPESLPFPTIMHPDDIASVERHFARMRTACDDEIVELEYRMRHANGQWHWLRSRDIPFLRDAQGRVCQILGAADDITCRKEADQALVQAQEDWVRTFDAVPDLIAILDTQRRIQRVNRAMADRLGYSPDGLLGLDCCHVFHSDGNFPVSCPHTAAVADGQVHSIEVCIGSLKGDFHVTASPLFDAEGQITGSVHVARDITDRKRGERALQESEEKYRGITQRSFDTICMLDLQGNTIYASPAAEKLSGVKPEELIGRRFSDFVVPSDVSRALAIFGSMAHGMSPEIAEAQVRRMDGTILFVEVTGAPIMSDGRAVGVQVIVRDVTQRKEAEGKLRQMELQVMHTARLSTMGEMVASIAHEVSQPLFSILNFTKASQNLLAAEDVLRIDELREWNDDITAAAVRAGEIIHRLRNFVRKSNNRREIAMVGKIVEESAALMDYAMRRHRVEVLLDLGGELAAFVDRVQIQQVLVNLLCNACDAMEHCEDPQRQVAIRVRTDAGFVKVSLSDTGAGLPPGGEPNLFASFFTTKQNGLGMGLAISKTIIESHGGSLWADNNAGRGATFHFTLPACDPQASRQEQADVE